MIVMRLPSFEFYTTLHLLPRPNAKTRLATMIPRTRYATKIARRQPECAEGSADTYPGPAGPRYWTVGDRNMTSREKVTRSRGMTVHDSPRAQGGTTLRATVAGVNERSDRGGRAHGSMDGSASDRA